MKFDMGEMTMSVKHSHEIKEEHLEIGSGISKQVLISSEEAPHFAMRRFVIQPGGRMPEHINLVEHEQFVLAGQAEIGIGAEIFHVQKGDVVFIPGEIPHWYKNIGDEPFEFLCLVPNEPDETIILE